jgi:hypothetical protein
MNLPPNDQPEMEAPDNVVPLRRRTPARRPEAQASEARPRANTHAHPALVSLAQLLARQAAKEFMTTHQHPVSAAKEAA